MNKYVWKYLVKGKFHGYHVSTFCEVTKDLINAKLYGNGSEEQKSIILGNLTSVLNATGLFSDVHAHTREIYWKDVNLEDVNIEAMEVVKGTLNVFDIKKVN